MRTSRLHAMLVAVIGVACSDSTTAPVTTWTATITVANETPAPTGTSTLGGTASVMLTGGGTGTGTLTYSVTLTGAPTSTITAMHIHGGTATAGAAGTAGPVRVNLCGASTMTTDNRNSATWPTCPAGAGSIPSTTVTWPLGSTSVGGTGLTFDQLVSAVRAFNTYANVHTTTNGGGEARGQLIVPAAP